MERGVRCPNCGSYTSFADILATERCRGVQTGDCGTRLWLDLVVGERPGPLGESVEVDGDG